MAKTILDRLKRYKWWELGGVVLFIALMVFAAGLIPENFALIGMILDSGGLCVWLYVITKNKT